MKKILIVIVLAITTIVAYQTAKYCLHFSYKENAIDVTAQQKLYTSIYEGETIEQIINRRFYHDNGFLFLKMIGFNLVWAGVIAFVIFLFKKENKGTTPSESTREEAKVDAYYEPLYHWPIWGFTFIGVLLIPLLIGIDSSIAHWILR